MDDAHPDIVTATNAEPMGRREPLTSGLREPMGRIGDLGDAASQVGTLIQSVIDAKLVQKVGTLLDELISVAKNANVAAFDLAKITTAVETDLETVAQWLKQFVPRPKPASVGLSAATIPPGYMQIAPGLFRGPRPTAQIVKAFQPPLKTIVDLEPTAEQFVANEIHIPMSQGPFSPPKLTDVDKAAAIMADPTQRPCLVHCHHGKSRTGAVCAYYQVTYSGYTPQEAWDEMMAMHFEKWRFFAWRWPIWEMLKIAELATYRGG